MTETTNIVTRMPTKRWAMNLIIAHPISQD
jgi:hypothetical protein